MLALTDLSCLNCSVVTDSKLCNVYIFLVGYCLQLCETECLFTYYCEAVAYSRIATVQRMVMHEGISEAAAYDVLIL